MNRTQENVLNGPQGSTKSSRDQNQEEMNEFDPAKLKRQVSLLLHLHVLTFFITLLGTVGFS